MSIDHTNGAHRDTTGYDPTNGTYRLQHDWAESTSLTYTILSAVAAIVGDEPHELTPFSDIADPDAIDRLFDPAHSDPEGVDAALTLQYNRCTITVFPDGWIVIVPPGK